MNRTEFKGWLIEHKKYKTNTANSRVSNVNRIDKEYNLDAGYRSDGLQCLLDTIDDAIDDVRKGLDPLIDIEIKGDYYTGLSTLKSALLLYVEYLNCSQTDVKTEANNYYADEEISEENNDTDDLEKQNFSSYYCGDLQNFKTYIAAGYRNKVNTWAKPARENRNSICEWCGNKRELQSAHREGMEFKDIIVSILDKHYKTDEEGIYKVPLEDFEKKFKEVHKDIKKVFFFLCQDCHNKYDKTHQITTEQLDDKRTCAD